MSGCQCPPQAFDSTHTERVSVTHVHEFPVGGGVAAEASRRSYLACVLAAGATAVCAARARCLHTAPT